MIGSRIADLLEEKPGQELANHAGSFPFKDVDGFIARSPAFRQVEAQLRILAEGEAEFPKLARARFMALRSRRDMEYQFIWRGAIWSMQSFLDRLIEGIRGGKPIFLPHFRHRFEAYTGIDCTSFFDVDGDPNFLGTMAVVEDFLESGAIDSYLPGHRYFFGHPIPD